MTEGEFVVIAKACATLKNFTNGLVKKHWWSTMQREAFFMRLDAVYECAQDARTTTKETEEDA